MAAISPCHIGSTEAWLRPTTLLFSVSALLNKYYRRQSIQIKVRVRARARVRVCVRGGRGRTIRARVHGIGWKGAVSKHVKESW